MNFLAHLYLSGDSDQILVGNFIADFLQGGETGTLPQEITAGIVLHREIDSYTNTHKLFSRSKRRLWQRHRHYSAVIVDLIYDHFLAKYWEEYAALSLEEYATQAYSTLYRYRKYLPPGARHILPRMSRGNWLVHYRDLEGFDRAMQGLARRARFTSNLATAAGDLRHDYLGFSADFTRFFPQLEAHCREHLNTLAARIGKGEIY